MMDLSQIFQQFFLHSLHVVTTSSLRPSTIIKNSRLQEGYNMCHENGTTHLKLPQVLMVWYVVEKGVLGVDGW